VSTLTPIPEPSHHFSTPYREPFLSFVHLQHRAKSVSIPFFLSGRLVTPKVEAQGNRCARRNTWSRVLAQSQYAPPKDTIPLQTPIASRYHLPSLSSQYMAPTPRQTLPSSTQIAAQVTLYEPLIIHASDYSSQMSRTRLAIRAYPPLG